jgi:hypothetical protein
MLGTPLTSCAHRRRSEGSRGIQLPCLARWKAPCYCRRRFVDAALCAARTLCAVLHDLADYEHIDGYVRIWSTEAILNSNNPDYTKPKQLAAVSHHSGTIHAVRFSSNNKYLASGADDKIVCIYALDPNAPTHAAFGG